MYTPSPLLLEPFLTAANRNAVAIQAMIVAISDQIALVGVLDLDWNTRVRPTTKVLGE